MRVIVSIAPAVLASCYSPQLRDCELACSMGACPAGFTCEAGVCRTAGFTGSCTSTDGGATDSAMTDGRQLADGPGFDAQCSYTCFSPGAPQTKIGSTGCKTASNNCSSAFSWLNPIDLCQCSAGFPALYLQRIPGQGVNIALVASPPPGASTYAMTIDGGMCFGTGHVCPQTALTSCSTAAVVDSWVQAVVTAGQHTFRFYIDDGATGCTGAISHMFTVTVP